MKKCKLFSSAAPIVSVVTFGLSVPAMAQDVVQGEAASQCYADFDCVVSASKKSSNPDEILVSADRAEGADLRDFNGSATIVARQQIETRQTRNIEDVLRDVPGIAVSTVAGQTQIRLRGSEGNHTLVLVDGIEVSDPASGEFDFGTLQAELGSSVEVLRGPQSALYGNDALAGVVAYRSGEYDGFGAFAEAGSHGTINGAARWGIREQDIKASISTVVVTTDGEPNARGGTRDLGRDSYTVSGKVESQVSDNLSLRGVARYVETEGNFNNQDFGFGSPTIGLVLDSPGVGFENQAIYGLLGAQLETLDGYWTHDLSVQFADIERNTFNNAGRTSDTQSDRFKTSYVSAYKLADVHTLTFAADYELEGYNNVATFDDRREIENIGFVGEYRYSNNGLNLSAALRHDVNDRFEDVTTFRVGAGYEITDSTRLRAAIGTGVKNPTFTELFGFFAGEFVGNPDLRPEESFSWEVGVDQSFFNETATLSVTYFNAELDHEIVTTFPAPDFLQTPANAATESQRQGVEVALAAQLGSQWSFNAAYTYLDAEENGVTEVRRPENIASAALTWTHPDDAASATLVVRHNGEMEDSDFTNGFPAGRAVLDDFTLFNLNARLNVIDGVELFLRAENLFDERYEQVFSFVSPGRSIIGGIGVKF